MTQSPGQSACLLPSFIGESHIGCTGKPVLRAHDRGAMSNHKDERCGYGHVTVRHDANGAKMQSTSQAQRESRVIPTYVAAWKKKRARSSISTWIAFMLRSRSGTGRLYAANRSGSVAHA